MTRLFDRQLAQPDPPTLYDFLQTVQATDRGSDSPGAVKARVMMARPDIVRMARTVRAGGTGIRVQEIQGAHVVAAEAVHERVGGTPAPELFSRLCERSILPQHEATFIEAQKLRSLGPVSAFGWLVHTEPTEDGYALQAYLATEWGRGKLFSPLAVCYLDLDDRGRYRREADTDGPAAQFATPDDPQRPGLLPSILDPILHSLMVTTGTLLATLAILAEHPHLPAIIPDRAQSAAYRRRSGRPLVTYRRIPRETAALQDLFADLDTTS
ncbi:hypothetical protein [Streptomyces sp. PA03-2a]|uniref:hypothetical protein n=1 Tax=Streptomyces sp. PA03-2a TaxID=3028701 RepID=UPI0029A39623|nr:hypothetical protein [Streptomyces sp. PA03-2a]MDX2733462.1 hypothetical protein [Streptomyces sp. PA03-2a]